MTTESLLSHIEIRATERAMEKAMEKAMENAMEKAMEIAMPKAMEIAMPKAMERGRQEAILEVLATRFGSVPAAIRGRVESCVEEEQLKWLLRLATTCSSLERFEADFEARTDL